MSDAPGPKGPASPDPDGPAAADPDGAASPGPGEPTPPGTDRPTPDAADDDRTAADEPVLDLAPPGRSKLAMALVAAAVVVLVVGFVVARDAGNGSPQTAGEPTTTPPTDPTDTDPATTETTGPTTPDVDPDGEGTDATVDPAAPLPVPPPSVFPPEDGPDGDTRTVFELQVGDCWNDPPGFDDDEVPIDQVTVVECDLPHDNEVFTVFDLPAGDYDTEQVSDAARLGCLSAFEPFVGTPHADSFLDFFALWPRAESWAFGDREVVCSLYDMERTPLLGSMQGSNR